MSILTETLKSMASRAFKGSGKSKPKPRIKEPNVPPPGIGPTRKPPPPPAKKGSGMGWKKKAGIGTGIVTAGVLRNQLGGGDGGYMQPIASTPAPGPHMPFVRGTAPGQGFDLGNAPSSGSAMQHGQIAPGTGMISPSTDPDNPGFSGVSGLQRGFFKDPASQTGWSYSNGIGGVARHVNPNLHGFHRVLQSDDGAAGDRMRYRDRIGAPIWEAPMPQAPMDPKGPTGRAAQIQRMKSGDKGPSTEFPWGGVGDLAWTMTGIPGTYRVATGNAEGWTDYAEPLMAWPAFRAAGLAGKGLYGLGKRLF